MAAAGILVIATGSHAQTAGALAQNLQRQLNVEDAQFRQSFFASTPIADRLLLDAGGTFRFGYSLIDNARSQEIGRAHV